MLKKALLLVSGNAFGSAMLLVRNLIVARLISVENYGIASTFAMSMAIVEMMSQLGLHQMIVQDKDGDAPEMQAGLQGFQAFRGAISSLLLFAIAQPYADFLGVSEVAWAYQVIALIPFINGFVHFDIHRLKRHMKFLPSVFAIALPALASVLVLWPLAYFFGDYRVMLYALLVQSASMVIVSHLMAERGYRMRLDRALMKRSLGFGWPLLLNGLLLFAVFNGEKLVIGRELGMAVLAVFSMGVTLTLTPTLVLAGSAQSFFLPQLSALQDKAEAFQRLGMATMQSSLAIGVALALGAALIGAPVVHLLLGSKYDALLPLISPLAIAAGVRVCKAGSAVVALARGRTGNSMIANIPRVISIGISWWVAATTGDILTIVWIAVLAEIAGYVVSLMLVHNRVRLDLRPMRLPVAISFAVFIAVFADAMLAEPQPRFDMHFHWGQLVIAVLSVAAIVSMRELRHYLVKRGR